MPTPAGQRNESAPTAAASSAATKVPSDHSTTRGDPDCRASRQRGASPVRATPAECTSATQPAPSSSSISALPSIAAMRSPRLPEAGERPRRGNRLAAQLAAAERDERPVGDRGGEQ